MAYNPASEAKFLFELLDADYDFSVVGFDVEETVSDTFVVNLTLAGTEKLTFEDVKLQEGLLTVIGGVGAILNDESGDRYFHGIIRKFKHAGTSGRLQLYEAQMVPSLWLLSLEEKCRIFQDKPLKEILETLLEEQVITSDKYEFRLNRDDIFIKFSIQYQETNLHYLSRLLEHEGIFYFFEHFEDKHLLVFCDTEAFYQDIAGPPFVTFNTNGLVAEKENIYAFDFSERLRPGKLSQKNFNFKTPSVDLTTNQEAEIETDYEVYEYPGPYGETAKGDTMSQIRLEEIQALAKRGYGDSNCPRLQPGATFTLTDHQHDDLNAEYFVYAVTHGGEQPQILQEHGSGGSAHYSNSFSVIPANVTYRPERISSKPFVPGLLSAIVTGPNGEEIWPDKYGRVNVQFHFDREGKMDEKSSCWLRTVQFWNGTTWGSQFIPRIGDEVLVSFINGDMDYPVIIGSVPNEAKPPNYNLPSNKTQSGIKTRSTPGGGPDNYNELRFEDKKGAEEIYLQSEKDWNILVKSRKGQTVGGDSGTIIGRNRDTSVGGNSYTIVKGKSTEKAKEIIVGADDIITIVSGASSIVIAPEGIRINGPKVYINDGSKAPEPVEQPVSGCTGKGGGFGGGGASGGLYSGGSGGGKSTGGSFTSISASSATPTEKKISNDTAAPSGEQIPLGAFKGKVPSGGWAGIDSADGVPVADEWKIGSVADSVPGLGDLVSSGSASPLLKGSGLPGAGDLVSSAISPLSGDLRNRVSTITSVVQNPTSIKNMAINEGRSSIAKELDMAKGKLLEKTGMAGTQTEAEQELERLRTLIKRPRVDKDTLLKKF